MQSVTRPPSHPTPSPFPPLAEKLWEALNPAISSSPAITVEWMLEATSTNQVVLDRARQGDTSPLCLVANTQTQGRGQRGRLWYSQPDHSLMFSLGLPLKMSPPHASGLALAVALSLVQNIHPQVRIKWPNDLYLEGKKLGGILIETRPFLEPSSFHANTYVVIGVGINVCPWSDDSPNQRLPMLPQAISPAFVQNVQPNWDITQTAYALIPPLWRDLQRFEVDGLHPWAEQMNDRHLLHGQRIEISSLEGLSRYARVLGLNLDGSLQIEDEATGQQQAISHTTNQIKLVN